MPYHLELMWHAGFLPAKKMAWERREALAQQQAKLQGAPAGQAAEGSAARSPDDLRQQALASFIGSAIQVYVTSAEVGCFHPPSECTKQYVYILCWVSSNCGGPQHCAACATKLLL